MTNSHRYRNWGIETLTMLAILIFLFVLFSINQAAPKLVPVPANNPSVTVPSDAPVPYFYKTYPTVVPGH